MARAKTLADVVAGLAHEPFVGGFGSLEVAWKVSEGSLVCHKSWPPENCEQRQQIARSGNTVHGRLDTLAEADLCAACFGGKELAGFLVAGRIKSLVDLQRARDALVSHLRASPEGSYVLYKRLKEARQSVRHQWGGGGTRAQFVAEFLATADWPLEEIRRRSHQLREELAAEFARAQKLPLDALDVTPTLVGFASDNLGFGAKNPLCVKAVEVYRIERDRGGLMLVAPRFVVDHLLSKLAAHRSSDFTTAPLRGPDGGEVGGDVLEVATALWDPKGAITSVKAALEMGEAAVRTPGWDEAAA